MIFFDFLLSSMSIYIGSFFSVIILSFFLKLMLYKNQIDNLNNAIKREILYDDINNLFKGFSNTRNLAKRKAIKNKQKKLIKN